jgi:UDP-GlcNAc:undecaprenyl-phosphate/decaprenyl-phosphate GlcNAc-1-phosphate transferase
VSDYIVVLLVAAGITYLLTPAVRGSAIAAGAIRAVRTRDVHVEPTPVGGGLAMYGGLAAGLLVADQIPALQIGFTYRMVSGLLLAAGVLVAVGAIDDRWGLSPISKLAAQVAAGGILVWSGVKLDFLPKPGRGTFVLTPDQSMVLTILLVVVTINAINFIDGLDGLAAGIVAIAALSYFVYSYTLVQQLHLAAESMPTVASALLAGMCLGFLPHNFHPARIFMGDTGSMLLGLMLAYGPLATTSQFDPGLLAGSHVANRFPSILPILLPVAILVIPYTDLMLAVIRRTMTGMSPFAADKKHLHHRLLNIGHSYRQSVLIMYLWAVFFVAAVVSLSIIRTPLYVFVIITATAVLVLLPVTMPRLRPWGMMRGLRDGHGGRGAL